MLHPAALGIIRAEHQPADAEQADGVGAHGAGFEGDEEVAAGQARAAETGGGGPQREDFGVGGGVVVGFGPVAGGGEERAVCGGVRAVAVGLAIEEADGEEAASGGEGGEVGGVADSRRWRARAPLAPRDYAVRFPLVRIGVLRVHRRN